MSKSAFDSFAPPPAWRVFEPLLRELDDDTLRIDPVTFMAAIMPAFLRHANAMVPRKITKPIGGKRQDTSITHYVFSFGCMRGGPYAYRLISVDTEGRLEMLDATRLPDDSELFGRHANAHTTLSKLNSKRKSGKTDPRDKLETFGGKFADMFTTTSTTDGRFDALFEKHRMLDRLVRHIRSSSEWVSDMRFIVNTEHNRFYGANAGRDAVIAEMLKDAEEVIGTRAEDMPKRAFIKKLLQHCLQDFDEAMAEACKDLLQEIKGRLNGDVIDILSINPSGVTTRNYSLLTRNKKPEASALWRQAARACPIILLMQDRTLSTHELLGMAQGGFNPDRVVTHYFGVTKPERLAFYKSLREANIGTGNAERVKQLGYYLEQLGGLFPDPQTPAEWDKLATLVDAAQGIAPIVGRDTIRVLRDLMNTGDQTPEQTIYRYFTLRDHYRYASISNLFDWKARIVASVLVPKIVVASKKRGINIPLQHIFHMVSADSASRREIAGTLSKPQRRAIERFNEEQSFLGVIFEGVSALRLLETAHEFAVHRHDWDEAVKDRIYSNRLFENGIQYPFPSLPEIHGIDEFDSVVPIRRMDELLKECLDLRDFTIMQSGHRIAKEPIHFVSVRSNDARTCAIACLLEPQGPMGHWTIRDIVSVPQEHRNRAVRDVVERYIRHPDFLKNIDLANLANKRMALRQSLVSRAQDRELMGFKVGNISERRAILEALSPYVRIAGGWKIDGDGCIDAPKINAVTDALLRAVGPVYQRSGGATPAIA
ncbi:MAG: hypothetical protein KGQ41_06590 [Alphaproteobacteria bacterium]|nr:hypothetical protein [Alphaproteobacteria bacterium]